MTLRDGSSVDGEQPSVDEPSTESTTARPYEEMPLQELMDTLHAKALKFDWDLRDFVSLRIFLTDNLIRKIIDERLQRTVSLEIKEDFSFVYDPPRGESVYRDLLGLLAMMTKDAKITPKQVKELLTQSYRGTFLAKHARSRKRVKNRLIKTFANNSFLQGIKEFLNRLNLLVEKACENPDDANIYKGLTVFQAEYVKTMGVGKRNGGTRPVSKPDETYDLAAELVRRHKEMPQGEKEHTEATKLLLGINPTHLLEDDFKYVQAMRESRFHSR